MFSSSGTLTLIMLRSRVEVMRNILRNQILKESRFIYNRIENNAKSIIKLNSNSVDKLEYHPNDLVTLYKELFDISIQFVSFLQANGHSFHYNPLMINLNQMIDDENCICINKHNHSFNQKLLTEIIKLKTDY